jgi:hypothetical protein
MRKLLLLAALATSSIVITPVVSAAERDFSAEAEEMRGQQYDHDWWTKRRELDRQVSAKKLTVEAAKKEMDIYAMKLTAAAEATRYDPTQNAKSHDERTDEIFAKMLADKQAKEQRELAEQQAKQGNATLGKTAGIHGVQGRTQNGYYGTAAKIGYKGFGRVMH